MKGAPRHESAVFKNIIVPKRRYKINRSPKNYEFKDMEISGTARRFRRLAIGLSLAILPVMLFCIALISYRNDVLTFFEIFPPIVTIALSRQFRGAASQKILALTSAVFGFAFICMACYYVNVYVYKYGDSVWPVFSGFLLLPVLLPLWIFASRKEKNG